MLGLRFGRRRTLLDQRSGRPLLHARLQGGQRPRGHVEHQLGFLAHRFAHMRRFLLGDAGQAHDVPFRVLCRLGKDRARLLGLLGHR